MSVPTAAHASTRMRQAAVSVNERSQLLEDAHLHLPAVVLATCSPLTNADMSVNLPK
jgi:hypothetical protein